jgi:hypothetical protein
MFVPVGCPKVHIAPAGLVNALDQTEFFQFIQGAIDRHQAQARVIPAAKIVEFDWIQGASAVR